MNLDLEPFFDYLNRIRKRKKNRVILLLEGPLDGTLHEVHKNCPIPDKLGLPNEDRTKTYWYEVHDDQLTAKYKSTEAS